MSDEPKRSTFWQDLLHIAVATAVGNVVITGTVFLFFLVVWLLSLFLGEWLDSLPELVAQWVIMLGVILGLVIMALWNVLTPFAVVWRMSKAPRDLIRRQLNPLFWGAFSIVALAILAAVCWGHAEDFYGSSSPPWLWAGFHFLLLTPALGWFVAVARLKRRETTMNPKKAWRAALYGGFLLYVASWWLFVCAMFLNLDAVWFPRWLPDEIPYLISACVLFPFALAAGAKMLLKAMEE